MSFNGDNSASGLSRQPRRAPAGRRVLLLASQPIHERGGAEHASRELADCLVKRGYEVEVLDLRTASPAWLWKFLGSFDRRLAVQVAEFFLTRAVRARCQPNVSAIISQGDVGFLPLRLPRGVKLIHFYHGTFRGQADAIRPFISRLGFLYLKYWDSMVLERAGGRGKMVVCNSDQTRAEVERFFGHAATTVWYPLDIERFRPLDRAEAERRLGITSSGKVGLFVGSAGPMKNLAIVRGLVRDLPEVSWLVALRGSVPKDFLDHPRIRLFHDATDDQLPLLYNAADFSVCPSLFEPFGYVVAESLACGTPVVAAPGGASRRFLREAPLDRLLISDPRSLEGFRRSVEAVLRDPQVYRQAIIQSVRPELEQLMEPGNWSRRFGELVGL